MKLKELESQLEGLEGFERPRLDLEQYATSAHQASRMIFTAENSYDDISGKAVLDLGCGCGILSIGASLAGASHVLAVDVDPSAIALAIENLSSSNLDFDVVGEIDFLVADVSMWSTCNDPALSIAKRKFQFNTIVMNPPFGTKPETKGMDMEFLRRACEMAETAVYSLHKSSTRDYIQRRVRSWGFEGEVLAQMRYDLSRTMKMHKQNTVDIQVDFWRFVRNTE